MIEVSVEPERKLVRARMGGLLTVEEVGLYARLEEEAVRSMGLASGEFYVLIETDGDMVQTQEVMNAFIELAKHSPIRAIRIATVRAGALTRMQSRRVAGVRSDTAVFEDVRSAEAWLFGG